MYQQMRVAKHTNSIDNVQEFYTTKLGFEVLGSFDGNDGYNGIFLGLKNQGWHLEFTQSSEKMERKSDPDDMIVLYYNSEKEYFNTLKGLKDVEKFVPRNPYWQVNGVLIKDPDGNQIILCYNPDVVQ